MAKHTIKKNLRRLGPGLITGASDDDPSGIATYSQAGAQFGYHQLWTALYSLPLITIIQEICGRIGVITGKGLSTIIKEHYAKPFLYVTVTLLFVANTINVGADLGAMAASAEMIMGLPFIFWLIAITIVTLVLEIFVSYKNYERFLKYLTFSLLAYIAAAFVVQNNWVEIFYATLIPTFSFSKEFMMNIVAILGTTISPYLFFWQTNEEVEEAIKQHRIKAMLLGRPAIALRSLKNMRFDTALGMLFSNSVMFFIIVTTAATLGKHGLRDIETSVQAAAALQPLAGNFAYLLFTLGIIGIGLLAVPVLAGSASYAIAEALNWKSGLNKKFKQAYGFYGVIILATLIGVLVNFLHITPFKMLYYTAIINGITAPPLLCFIMLISNNKNIMGEYINGKTSNIFGWLTVIVMSLAALMLLIPL